ncbi:hypothetical protein STRIP9103_01317 [Streptomyces ipomoeae 91-03]|uniref:Uncharacterized protein n=1 Tax=Streptomyces ipomoeae 91-03 TaxID=698759 RepID=L1L0C6_9ACTN|nr:hypothetical protein STRIP9103_01317 [Streptomyces ipomoeae 91-03]
MVAAAGKVAGKVAVGSAVVERWRLLFGRRMIDHLGWG